MRRRRPLDARFRARCVGVLAACSFAGVLLACGGAAHAPPAAPQYVGPKAPPSGVPEAPPSAACSGPGDDLVLDAATQDALERSPDVAQARLAPRATAPDAGLCLRLGYALARWSAERAHAPFPAWLLEQRIAAPDAERERALLRLTSRAIERRAIGVATAFYAAWLAPEPRGPALSADGRKTALDLFRLLRDAQESDLAERMAAATLDHDPEFVDLARELVQGFLGEDIVAFLRKWKASSRPPSWIGAIARELPMLTTLGELENPEARERIARAMGELGGVAPDQARRELSAALASMRERGAAAQRARAR